MELPGLLSIVVRASAMYLYALFLVRVSGKRSLGNLSPFDLVITFAVGDTAESVVYGKLPFAHFLVAFAVIILLHILTGLVSSRSERIYTLVSGTPTVLVRSASFEHDNLAAERIHPQEVYAELRLISEENLVPLASAQLENNGQVSVRRKQDRQPAQKGDWN